MRRHRKKRTVRDSHERTVEDRGCTDRQSFCPGTYGRGHGPAFSEAVQGAGRRTDLHGNGKREGHFLP